jgi:3-methyladenine DNA glycosylase Tag
LSTTSIIGSGIAQDWSLQKFAAIYERAAERKGGTDALEALLPKPKSSAQLKRITDDRYLAEMTKCVFRSGFVWQIIENKWPGFEAAFAGFDTAACAMLSDEDLEQLAEDARIVRNAKKIASVRGNAAFIRELKQSHGGCGVFLAQWPADDIVGLWDDLKRRGARLGGNTGPFFLRFVGKDTFMLSGDVVKALIRQKVVDKAPSGRKALGAVQDAFNAWRAESGRSLAEISRTLACSVA